MHIINDLKFAKRKSITEGLWTATGQSHKQSLFKVCVERILRFIDGTGLINWLKVKEKHSGLN